MAFFILLFVLQLPPSVDSAQMNEDFPTPGRQRQSHQRQEIVSAGNKAEQSQGWFASHPHVDADPESGGGAESDDGAHRLHVETRGKLAVGKIAEAGCHAAAHTRNSRSLEELTLCKSKGRMSSHTGGARLEHPCGDK
jgi:hypothetical protein